MTEKTKTKTRNEMVAEALANALTNFWRKDNPYSDPEDYPAEFQKFCENELTSILNNGIKE